MKKILFIFLFLVLKVTLAQVPDPNQLVTIHAATLAEINGIASPYEGSLVYNTDDKFLYQFNGTIWQKLTPEGNETKIVAIGNVSITGTGTATDPYQVSSIKSTFIDNGDGSFTFSNGIDTDVDFTPSLPVNTPIVSNSDAGIGNCTQFLLNENRDLIIEGAYFDGSSTVSVTGQTVNSIVINSTTQITANLNTGGAYGNFDISVTNNAGTGTMYGGFTLQAPSPLTTNNIANSEMVLSSNMNYDGTTLSKTGAGAAVGWTGEGYSLDHAITSSGGRLDFTPDQTNILGMVGLSYFPASTVSYVNLNFGMYLVSNAQIQIREDGASMGYVSSYAVGDVLSIDIDCLGRVTYLRNGAVIYTSSKVASGSLYFDSSLYHVNMAISNISMTY